MMPPKELRYPEDWAPIDWPVQYQPDGLTALIEGLKLLESRVEALRQVAVRQYEVDQSRVY